MAFRYADLVRRSRVRKINVTPATSCFAVEMIANVDLLNVVVPTINALYLFAMAVVLFITASTKSTRTIELPLTTMPGNHVDAKKQSFVTYAPTIARRWRSPSATQTGVKNGCATGARELSVKHVTRRCAETAPEVLVLTTQ